MAPIPIVAHCQSSREHKKDAGPYVVRRSLSAPSFLSFLQRCGCTLHCTANKIRLWGGPHPSGSVCVFGTGLLKIVVGETAETDIMSEGQWGKWAATMLITLPTNCSNQRGTQDHSAILGTHCPSPSVLSVCFLKQVCQKHTDWEMRGSWFSGNCTRVFCCLRLCFALPLWSLIYSGRKDEREHFSLNNQSRCTL